MKKKNHQKPTRTQGMSRREQNDRLANWYMINLGWSLLAIFILLGIRQGYRSSSTILYMQGAMWVFTAVFAVCAVALFSLAKAGIFQNALRARHYGYFMIACTGVGLWLALFNKLRPIMEQCAQKLFSNPALTVSSYWNIRIPMIGIAIYLVAGFIYLVVKSVNKL